MMVTLSTHLGVTWPQWVKYHSPNDEKYALKLKGTIDEIPWPYHELILQISCKIFLAFKWKLMMRSGHNISHQKTAKLFFHLLYTSGHCLRWRSRMEMKIMAGSLYMLYAHCKIAYFYSVTAEKWLFVSLPNFVTMRRTHLSISSKIFSWIRTTKLKDTRHGIFWFYKGFCKPKWFICTLLTDHNKHVTAKADSSLSNRRASLSRSLHGHWPKFRQPNRFKCEI